MTFTLTAVPAFRLPENYRYMGEPSAWAKMTRPGEPIHSFLEAAFFDAEANLWLSDVPYGRVFKVSPEGDWSLVHQIDGEPHAMRIAPDGRHIAVDYRHGLIELTGHSDFNVLSTGLESQPYLGLSDMAYASDGALWFTDSGRTSLSDPKGRVFCLSPVAFCGWCLTVCLIPMEFVSRLMALGSMWQLPGPIRFGGFHQICHYWPTHGRRIFTVIWRLGPDGLATNEARLADSCAGAGGRAYVFDALAIQSQRCACPRALDHLRGLPPRRSVQTLYRRCPNRHHICR